jgi:hypothetical protein
MPVCTQCGGKVQPNEKFCKYCGTPLGVTIAATTVPTATPAPASSVTPSTPPGSGPTVEVVVGVIPHLVQSAGRLKAREYFLISTNLRFLLIQFSPAMMQEALALSKANAKGFGKLLAGKVLLAGDLVEYCRKYFKMPPSQILAETSGNISVNLSEIRRAYIEFQQEEKDEDSHIQMDKYILTILSDVGEFT